MPPLAWLRAFEVSARHLSFTLAAHELGLTQSAISQNVRALEERLGTNLFVRGNRSLSLTQAGRLLLPDIATSMALLEQATARFIPDTTRPKLTVATSVSIAQWNIVPQLDSFRAAHPDCAVQIVTTIWPDDFTSTNADIEIRFGRKEIVGRDAELLEPSFLHAVCSPEIAEDFSTSNLSQHTLIQPVGISRNWQIVAKDIGLQTKIEASLFVDTHGLAVDLAVAGAGIALTHSQVTRAPISEGRLIELPLPSCLAEEGYYIARKPTRYSDLQDAFVSWFTEINVTSGSG